MLTLHEIKEEQQEKLENDIKTRGRIEIDYHKMMAECISIGLSGGQQFKSRLMNQLEANALAARFTADEENNFSVEVREIEENHNKGLMGGFQVVLSW